MKKEKKSWKWEYYFIAIVMNAFVDFATKRDFKNETERSTETVKIKQQLCVMVIRTAYTFNKNVIRSNKENCADGTF